MSFSFAGFAGTVLLLTARSTLLSRSANVSIVDCKICLELSPSSACALIATRRRRRSEYRSGSTPHVPCRCRRLISSMIAIAADRSTTALYCAMLSRVLLAASRACSAAVFDHHTPMIVMANPIIVSTTPTTLARSPHGATQSRSSVVRISDHAMAIASVS